MVVVTRYTDKMIRYGDNPTEGNWMSDETFASMAQDAKIKLNSVIPHFRNDIYWPSWIYLEVESRRVFQNSRRLLKGDGTNRVHNRPTGDQLLQQSMFGDWNIINEKISSTLPAFIWTGEPFFRNAESNIEAMLKSFSLPQLFVTITFSESWPEFQAIIHRAEQRRTLGWAEEHRQQNPLPTDFPWETVEYYYERLYHLRRYLLTVSFASGYGKLRESVLRNEFQLRQVIHSHMLLWVESSIPELIQKNYIRADVPDPALEPDLHRFVIAHQIHTCKDHLCGKSPGHSDVNNPYRKGFPQPLSSITYHHPDELRYRYARFKREDQNVVPYCPQFLLIWQAHINVQYVTSAGLSKYVTKYVIKGEHKSIVSVDSMDEGIRDHIEARRIGAMEIMCLLNSKPIIKLSSSVQFLPTAMPEFRSSTIKRVHEIEADPDNPYYPDSIEKYFKRPNDVVFRDVTYPNYFAQYVI